MREKQIFIDQLQVVSEGWWQSAGQIIAKVQVTQAYRAISDPSATTCIPHLVAKNTSIMLWL